MYYCFDTCSAKIYTADPLTGLKAVPLFWLAPLPEIAPFIALVAGVTIWAKLLRRSLYQREPD